MIAAAPPRSGATWSADGARAPRVRRPRARPHEDRRRPHRPAHARGRRRGRPPRTPAGSKPNRSAAASARPGAGLRHAHASSGACGQTRIASTSAPCVGEQLAQAAVDRARARRGRSSPRPTSAWFVTTTTPSPSVAAERRIASARAREQLQLVRIVEVVPTSTLIVPSRSSSTKRRGRAGSRHERGASRAIAAPRAHAVGVDLERRELAAHRPRARVRTEARASVGRRDQQVAAAAGAADLAARRAGLRGGVEHRLDRRVLGDVRVHALLRLERLAQHRAEPRHVAGLERVAHRVRHLVQLLHAEDRVLAARLVHARSGGRSGRRCAGPARVAQQEVLAELLEHVGPDGDRRHHDAVAANSSRLKPPNAAAY